MLDPTASEPGSVKVLQEIAAHLRSIRTSCNVILLVVGFLAGGAIYGVLPHKQPGDVMIRDCPKDGPDSQERNGAEPSLLPFGRVGAAALDGRAVRPTPE